MARKKILESDETLRNLEIRDIFLVSQNVVSFKIILFVIRFISNI